MRPLSCGDAALLVEVGGLAEVLALAAAVRTAAPPGVVDVVPAARTLLLTTAPGTALGALWRAVAALPVDPAAPPPDGPTTEIAVVYDGPDLDEVARLTGLTADGVVGAHTGTPWRVAFGGFAPGFAYLTGGDGRLRVPRRESPRTAVPAGSVGLAGEFSGVYPRSSPGGWKLIGRTGARLWSAASGALLRPGGLVRFVPATAATWTPAAAEAAATGARGVSGRRGLEVLATGPLALVQDLGRPGHADTGVSPSGAADRAALRLANRLLANTEGAAGIEVLLGGLAVRATGPLLVAVTGAPAQARVDGVPVGHAALVPLRGGAVLRLDAPAAGLRSYLGVRGGIAVEPVLGSRSTDTVAALGPPPLRPGDLLPVGPEPTALPLLDVAPVAPPTAGPVVLRAVPGPRADRLVDVRALARTTWTVSPRSDRVGTRLTGSPLRHRDREELPSEGVVRGAVQVPPGGEPVLFGADHPVTGGYPVVAVVLDADVDRAAQLRPGQVVRFRLVGARREPAPG